MEFMQMRGLDTAIGLALLFLGLSLIVSGLQEMIAKFLRSRSETLREGIRALLHDPNGIGLAKLIEEHPLITGLKDTSGSIREARFPSYIPSSTFAVALMDGIRSSSTGNLFVNARLAIANLPGESGVKKSLLALHDAAEGDAEKFKAAVEKWFDDSMDRVSGWYKRRTEGVMLLLSVIVVFLLNANALEVGKALWIDASLRSAVVQAAGTQLSTLDPESPKLKLEEVKAQLDALKLPIGWDQEDRNCFWVWGESACKTDNWWRFSIIGWLISAFAVSLGAPFWFSGLGALTKLRSAGVKPERADKK